MFQKSDFLQANMQNYNFPLRSNFFFAAEHDFPTSKNLFPVQSFSFLSTFTPISNSVVPSMILLSISYQFPINTKQFPINNNSYDSTLSCSESKANQISYIPEINTQFSNIQNTSLLKAYSFVSIIGSCFPRAANIFL